MSVRTTIDIPDDLHAELRRRAAAEHTSIRSLVISAIEAKFRPKPPRTVTGPLIGMGKAGKKGEDTDDNRALWETSVTDGWSIFP
jgi:hypothetical protein